MMFLSPDKSLYPDLLLNSINLSMFGWFSKIEENLSNVKKWTSDSGNSDFIVERKDVVSTMSPIELNRIIRIFLEKDILSGSIYIERD